MIFLYVVYGKVDFTQIEISMIIINFCGYYIKIG